MGNLPKGVPPGHVGRLFERLPDLLRAVDVVWEVLDARAPASTSNPTLARLAGGRPVVAVLAKPDLAAEPATARWRAAMERAGRRAPAIAEDMPGSLAGRLLADASRTALGGVAPRGRPMRAMVAGIPNVGKSTLINRIAGRAAAGTGARPGITRGEQWVRLDGLDLLDTPGVLPPRLGGGRAVKLRALGCVGDEAASPEEAAAFLVEQLRERAPRSLEARYGLEDESGDPWEVLARIGRRLGAIGAGGRVDMARAASQFLSDFQKGRIAAVTLEEPPS